MSENRRVVKAAGVIGSFTLLSRILGFIRDMIMANFFGSGLLSDAFIAAFRLPNLMRRLLAEGSLVLAFVPVFTDHLENKGREEAFRLAMSAVKSLTLILLGVTALGVVFSPWIMALLTPGFDQPEKMAVAVSLARIIFPYVFFVCMVALCMGILNSLGHFAAPALAPALLNVVMITAMVGMSYMTENKELLIRGLAWSVLVGGTIQLGLQVPFLIRSGLTLRIKSPFWHPGLSRIGRMMVPSVLGAGVYQVNIVAGTILASLLVEGSLTWLYYADRLFQFPLGIFAISMGTAVLPSLSRQASAGDMKGLTETFSQGLCFVFFITLPASVGLMVLSKPIVALLFKRGAFGQHDLLMTSQALVCYAVGLSSVSAVRVAAPVFYARQDAKTPVAIAVVSIVFNILLSLLLMGPMKHAGLALATSLASAVNLILLVELIRRQLGSIGGWRILISFCRSLICSLGMGAAVHTLAIYLIPAYNRPVFQMTLVMVICIGAGIVVYTALAFATRSPELESVVSLFRRKKVNP